MDDLIETLTATIEPESWDEVGGRGSIGTLGGLLVIQQTPNVHIKIRRLLTALREKGAAPRSVSINVFWLAVDADDVVAIGADASNALSADQVAKLSDHILARGQITCFDSQTVHLVAGTLRSAVTSFVPVVGQVEADSEAMVAARRATSDGQDQAVTVPKHVFGQVSGPLKAGEPAPGGQGSVIADRGSSVGYQPVTQTVNMGALLQVTPLLGDDAKTVAVDVHSIVIAPDKDIAPLDFANGMQIDRLSFTVQQFQTTLRMPIGRPTIVGGMTLQPTANETDKQMFLLMEVTAQ